MLRAIVTAVVCAAIAAPSAMLDQPATGVELSREWDPVENFDRFVVHLRDGGRNTRVKLSRWFKSVDRTETYGANRMLVIGRSSGAQTVAVVSLQDGTVTDEFLAYDVSLSLSKRFIAFERFWQPHGPPADHVVTIYDLERAAGANRLSRVPGLDAMKYVGIPIFPPAHAQSPDYFDGDPSNSEKPITNFVWLDDRTVSFIAYRPGASTLVTVTEWSGFARPRYGRYPLDHSSVVKERALGVGDDPALQFSGSVITKDNATGNILVELPESSPFKVKSISIPR